MNQREFEKAVEMAKVQAKLKLQEGMTEWLGNRATRGEDIANGRQENQAQGQEIQSTFGG